MIDSPNLQLGWSQEASNPLINGVFLGVKKPTDSQPLIHRQTLRSSKTNIRGQALGLPCDEVWGTKPPADSNRIPMQKCHGIFVTDPPWISLTFFLVFMVGNNIAIPWCSKKVSEISEEI